MYVYITLKCTRYTNTTFDTIGKTDFIVSNTLVLGIVCDTNTFLM